MKWNNKGYEFDKEGRLFTDISRVLIWGAGNDGKELAKKISGLGISILFIDLNRDYRINGVDVSGIKYNALNVSGIYSESKENTLLIIALKWENTDNAILAAKDAGWVEGVNLFEKAQFLRMLSIFQLYCGHRIYLPVDTVISLNFNEACTLKCTNCNASIPYLKDKKQYSLKMVQKDVDLLFKRIDYMELLRIGGGETLLYPYLKEVIHYLYEKYREQYGYIQFTTNGTVELSEPLLAVIKESNTWVCISDYRKQIPKLESQYDKLRNQLEEWGIRYDFLEEIEWVNFGMNNTCDKYKETPMIWHDLCRHPCKDYRNGKLYSCSQAYYAVRRYQELYEKDDFLDLEKTTDKNVILEYLSGYSNRGFLPPCRICNGHMNLNHNIIPAAEQM